MFAVVLESTPLPLSRHPLQPQSVPRDSASQPDRYLLSLQNRSICLRLPKRENCRRPVTIRLVILSSSSSFGDRFLATVHSIKILSLVPLNCIRTAFGKRSRLTEAQKTPTAPNDPNAQKNGFKAA